MVLKAHPVYKEKGNAIVKNNTNICEFAENWVFKGSEVDLKYFN